MCAELALTLGRDVYQGGNLRGESMKYGVLACAAWLTMCGIALAQPATVAVEQAVAEGLETFCKPWLDGSRNLPQYDLVATQVEPLGWIRRDTPDGIKFSRMSASGMLMVGYHTDGKVNYCDVRVAGRGPIDIGPSNQALEGWLKKTFPTIKKTGDHIQAAGSDLLRSDWAADNGVTARVEEPADKNRRGPALVVTVQRRVP